MKTKILLIAIITTIMACKKEAPVTKSGNTNIKGSDNISLAGGWNSIYSNGNDFTFQATVNWPDITQQVIDRGTILAYIKDNSSVEWTALPYSDSGSDYSLALNYYVGKGSITIEYTGSGSSTPTISDLNTLTIRIVVMSASGKKEFYQKNIDEKNCQSVYNSFNLN